MKLLKKIHFKKALKNILFLLSTFLDDIFLVSGIVLLSIGAFKIYLPAGYIILGICLIAFAFYIAQNSAEKVNKCF